MSKHMEFQCLRVVKHKGVKKLKISQNIGYSTIILFMYVGKEEICKYMQYEVSMTVCYGRDSKSKKSTKMATI